ncbi:hypothetical protein Tco_0209776 [Tanacetum coccineum]
MNSRDHVKSISTTVKTNMTPIHRIGPNRYAVSVPQNSKLFFMPRQVTIPFPSRLYDDCCDKEEGLYELKDLDASSIRTTLLDDACLLRKKTQEEITLRVGNNKVVFKSDKPASNIIKRVDALSLRERMKLDLEARLMGEALILNRSLDPLYGDYIELNDLNEPLELRRNQVDDLEPTIEEGEIIDEPIIDVVKIRCDSEIIDGLDEYPSYEHVNANFFPLLSINVMSKDFYNSIMKDKVEYKGKNIVGAFMNVPIFVENFSVMTDFAAAKTWILIAMKEWVISFSEDHFVNIPRSKQDGLME